MVWIVIIGCILFFSVLFWPILSVAPGMLIYGDDIHRQYYFYREFIRTAIATGKIPWWNPYLFSGEPFYANPVVNLWYPPNWLFFLPSLPLAYSLHIFFHLCLACCGMVLFLSFLFPGKKNYLAWAVSGVTFALSGFFMGRLFAGHVDVIASASYIPLVLFMFMRGLGDGGRRWVWTVGSAFVFCLQLLSGYQTMAFFTVIAVGIASISYAIFKRSFRPLLWSMCTGMLGFAYAAFQVVPVYEFFFQSIRSFSLPYSWSSYGHLTVSELIQVFSPFQFGLPFVYHGPPPNYAEHAFFVGVTGIVFLILAIILFVFRRVSTPFSVREKVAVVVFFGSAILGIWLSLGPAAPIDLYKVFWTLLPNYHTLRIPSRHLLLAVFGMSGLIGVSVVVIMRSARHAAWLVLVLVGIQIIEMSVFTTNFIYVREIPPKRHEKMLTELFTPKKGELFRILPNFGAWIPPRDALDFDAPMAYGIFSASGYDPTIYKPYYTFFSRALAQEGSDLMLSVDVQVPYLTAQQREATRFLNIRYLLVPSGIDPFIGNTGFRLVRETDGDHGYRVYAVEGVYSRFFLVSQAERLGKDMMQRRIAALSEGELHNTVFLEEDVPFFADEASPCMDPHASVSVVSYELSSIVLHTSSTCAGWLSSSEVYYPGWRAKVDGKYVDIYKSNISFRAIKIPNGKHQVEFEFVPVSLIVGGMISLMAVLGTCIVVIWVQKRRQ